MAGTANRRAKGASQAAADGREVRPGPAALLYLGLALTFFLPALLPGRHIFGTDYLAGGYFFYDFVSDRLGAGDLPKWVPYIFGGLPLFANPGSAYQPVHLLMSFLLPTSKVLPAVFVVHFWLAGFGMYLLARELRCRGWVAFVTGIAFQFTGLIVSWVYAGHDGRIIVATLAPLFFYFLRRGIRTTAPAPFAGAAGTLGLALLSFQIQNSYYLLVAAAIWAIYSIVHLGIAKQPAVLGRVVALGLSAVAFGFLLAAVNFLPFLGYLDESPRGMEGGRGYEYSTSFSMPEGELIALAVPEAHGVSIADPVTGEPLFPQYTGENGFKLHTEYVGAFVLVLLALGFYHARRDRDWWFFLGLAGFMLTIALGGNTPLYRLYYAVLPGTPQFRAPSLAFFVVALALVAMAGLTLERLAERREAVAAARDAATEAARGDLKNVPLIAAAVVLLAFLGMVGAGEEAAAGWGRFLLFAAATSGVLWLWTAGRANTTLIAALLALLTVADLWVVGRRFLHTVDPPEVIFAQDDVVTFLRAQPQPARIWTFPLVQQYRGGGAYGGDFPMLYDIEQVGGEHPNPLRRWVEYLGAGTETYIDWHNVIVDPQVVDTPDGQAVAFRSMPGFLEAANVRYIVSMVPLADPALREVHRGSALIYERLDALPRAYLVPAVRAVTEEESLAAMTGTAWDPRQLAFVSADHTVELPNTPLDGSAEVLDHSPDRVVVRATTNRPALLVLADNYYDGWNATVNGSATPVLLTNHTMRGVVVPAGTNEVVFEFHPTPLFVGFYVYLAGMITLLAVAARAVAASIRARRPSPAAT